MNKSKISSLKHNLKKIYIVTMIIKYENEVKNKKEKSKDYFSLGKQGLIMVD